MSIGFLESIIQQTTKPLSYPTEHMGLAANAEEIAWLLIYRSLFLAMKTLIDEKTELKSEKFDSKALQTQIN